MLIQAEVLTMPSPSLLNASAHRLRYAFTYLFCIIQKTPCLYNSKHRSTNRKVCATSPSAQGIPQQSAEGYWVPTLIFNVLKEGLHTRHPKDWSPVMVETEKFLDRIREKKECLTDKENLSTFLWLFPVNALVRSQLHALASWAAIYSMHLSPQLGRYYSKNQNFSQSASSKSHSLLQRQTGVLMSLEDPSNAAI